MKSCELPVANVLAGLQPATRLLVERALAAPVTALPERQGAGLHTERELSRLLDSLDKQLVKCEGPARRELQRIAETCAAMLQAQVISAEVFAQLAARAHGQHDFARLDALGEVLQRFAPSEVCEVARHPHPVIRALGCETLVHLPTHQLAQLLTDIVDAPLARFALEQKAFAYDSEEALRLLHWWDDDAGEFDEMI